MIRSNQIVIIGLIVLLFISAFTQAAFDPNTALADRFKVSLEKAEYRLSASVRNSSQNQRKQRRERLELYCNVRVLDNTSLAILGISQQGIITQIEKDKGKTVAVIEQSQQASRFNRYEAPRYRSGPVVPSKPIRPAIVKRQQAIGRQPQWTDVLEPVRMRLNLDPELLELKSKKINRIKGHFYALTAEKIEYVEIPFKPDDKWVSLTPDIDIKVLEAQSTESDFSYRIETRKNKLIPRDLSLHSGSDLLEHMPLKREFLKKDGKPVRRSSSSRLRTSIGGQGSGSGGNRGIVEKIRFAIAVNPKHQKILFELENIPLPDTVVNAAVQEPSPPAAQVKKKAHIPAPSDAPAEEKAHTPNPPHSPDGTIHRDTWITLSWKPGSKAVSHDVYFGDNYDDVNGDSGKSFRGNQKIPHYVIGFPGKPYPNGLVPDRTYYWRIDEVNEANPDSPWKGDVWSFTVLDNTKSKPTSGVKKPEDKVRVVKAIKSLPAMTVVTREHIKTELVSKDALPQGHLTNPAKIIGRVLAVPVVEGQVLTEACLVSKSTSMILATQIPKGMRAVTVPISNKMMPDSILLYPGCVVDVFVTYNLPPRASEGQAISTTMLRGIHILAVSGKSIVSKPDAQKENKKQDSNRGTLVTLLVTPKQAETLILARENGSISLTLRNPLQKEPIDGDNPLEPFKRDQNRRKPRWKVEVIRGRDRKVGAEVEAVVAKTSLPAGTVITHNHIKKEMVPRDELPEGQLVKPARIIGRVLSAAVVEGQILTEACLVPEGTYMEVMRAVTISVSSKAMPDHILLYPGCVVDVLVKYKLSSQTSEGQTFSTAMLRGVNVLAVSGESIVSKPDAQKENKNKKQDSNRGTRVTLLVDPKQAEILKLAVENGTISLSLRNPLDKSMFKIQRKVLIPGKIQHFYDEYPYRKNNDIWKKIDYWQLLPEDHPRRLQLLLSD